MPEWDAEIEVDADRARELIATQFPELRDASVRMLAAGWDNVVHLVGERWAFRFPRREIAVPGVHRELETLGRLAGHLPLAIPVPHYVSEPADGYPWPWFGAEFLPGVELAEARLPDDARVELGAALGAFLRTLHAPRLARLVGTTLPVDPMRRADMSFRVAQVRRRVERLAEAGLWTPTPDLERLFARAAALPVPPRTVVLHGDLHMRHVLVDATGRATGVIDWGDVCAGDPSVDLSIAYASLAGDARAALTEAYGPIDGLTELRARVVGAFLAAALLEYAADRGTESLGEEARRSLERVLA